MSIGVCGVPPPGSVLSTGGVCSLGRSQIVWVAGVEEVGVRLPFCFPELRWYCRWIFLSCWKNP